MFVRDYNVYNLTNITTVLKGIHNACIGLKLRNSKCSFVNFVRYNTGLNNQYLMIYKVKRMILYVRNEQENIDWNESQKRVFFEVLFYFIFFKFKNDIDEIKNNSSIGMILKLT